MVGVVQMSKGSLTIIRYHHPALRGIRPFCMVSGYGILKQFGELKGMHIDFIKHILHVEEINEVFRILEMPHDCGYPGRHFLRTNDPNLAGFIDHIMAEKELL